VSRERGGDGGEGKPVREGGNCTEMEGIAQRERGLHSEGEDAQREVLVENFLYVVTE
jgi:hypothetical protein